MPARKGKIRWPFAHITRMSAHSGGTWVKRINGKIHHFGPWRDPQAALDKWDAMRRGQLPADPIPPGSLTVKDLCDLFGTFKHQQVEAGELSVKMLNDYRRAAQLAADHLGKQRLVSELRPADFAELRNKLSAIGGAHDVANNVRRVRSIFKWAYENEHIDKPVRYGSSFSPPKASALRKATAASNKLMTAAQVRSLIAKARGPVKAFIYLGLNCGFGATDIAELTADAIDFKSRMIRFPRPKTGVDRQCPLWPQTARAVRRYAKGSGLAFTTAQGNPWVRFKTHRDKSGAIEKSVRIDSIALEYNKARVLVKPKPPPFYALRHTFRTVADEVGDQHAVHRIMGHDLPGLSSVYVRRIGEERLRAVVEHVRLWLINGQKKSRAKARTAGPAARAVA